MADQPAEPLEPSPRDGRNARRERNRSLAVDAALELFLEGKTDFDVDAVAERSGLSVRSLFRYFDTLEDVRTAAAQRAYERAAPILTLNDPGEGPLGERTRRFVDARIRACQALLPAVRLLRARASTVPDAEQAMRRFASALDAQVRTHFAPELAERLPAETDTTVSLICALVSVPGWEYQTMIQGLTETRIRQAWITGVNQLLRRDPGHGRNEEHLADGDSGA